MPWGLIPSWWTKTAKEVPAFNARAETLAVKPMFRDAFRRNRCLIPASGYYEWLKTPTGNQPYYYSARDGVPLTMVGLWDEWKDIETGMNVLSCTMIVTNANALAGKVHDRMPVLLQPEDFPRWLAGTAGTEMLKPAPDDYAGMACVAASRVYSHVMAVSDRNAEFVSATHERLSAGTEHCFQCLEANAGDWSLPDQRIV
jgi:putative SOS response-associated peptidase YedK